MAVSNLYDEATGVLSYKNITQGVNNAPVKECKGNKKADPCNYANPLYDAVLKNLRILDEQTAVNSGVWYNLPDGLTSQDIERFLYYRYQLGGFWLDDQDDGFGTFYFLPPSKRGNIDCYGRMTKFTPIPMGTPYGEKDPSPWIEGLERKVIRAFPEAFNPKYPEEYGLLLYDYTPQIANGGVYGIPRQQLIDPILKYMAEIICMSRTRLKTSTGVQGVRVQDKSCLGQIIDANNMADEAAVNGKRYVGVVSQFPLEDLGMNNSGNIQDFLTAFQTLENLRLSLHGIKTNGVGEKPSTYVNNAQSMVQQSNTGLAFQDGVTIRKNFCAWWNQAFGPLQIHKTGGLLAYEPSESIVGIDMDMNGLAIDDSPFEQQTAPAEGGETDAND